MKHRGLKAFLVASLLFTAIIACPNDWLAANVDQETVEKAATELNPLVFQGREIQDKMWADSRYLPIIGSSELARLDQFHPSRYFRATKQPFIPFLIGRGGTQSLSHVVNLASRMKALKNRKVVIVLSPQWFKKEGLDAGHFVPNFSALQGYDLAFNRQLSPSLKQRLLQRLMTMPGVKDDDLLTSLYEAQGKQRSWEHELSQPVATMYKQLLTKKDLYYSSFFNFSLYSQQKSSYNTEDWQWLAQKANDVAAPKTKSNRFHIVDYYYKMKIGWRLPELRNKSIGSSYGESSEYDDLQLLLDLLKEAGAKPLFISVPVNGPWYDYVGFPKEGRTAYYTKVKAQIERAGFPVADLSRYEYEPYFMKDTIHIGWKGWVYTNRAILAFYRDERIDTSPIETKN